ncbi:helix-turn-helix transcriptional regulator [Devosia sp. XK-2]|uniref:helix-turn-helix domain-containing protein n=1 Tax=Devosia sp. XK-2 TaxID=3126689 RepID=UPI0030D10C6F
MQGRARIAWNLRRIRGRAGLSQESLAVDADVDRTYISDIERATFSASVNLLDKLASALGVDVSEFLRMPDEGEDAPRPLTPGRKAK